MSDALHPNRPELARRKPPVSRALLPLIAASALGLTPAATQAEELTTASDPSTNTATAPVQVPEAAPAAPAPEPASVLPPTPSPPASLVPQAPGAAVGPTPTTPTDLGADASSTADGMGPDGSDLSTGGAPAPTAQATDSSLVAPNLLSLAGVGSATIGDFDIPPFLLPIYQAAGSAYDIPWPVLASINRIETDYGRNLHVSSAGAQGWMQFMPATWATYGTDANADGVRDPYNPADAIFAAARYLRAAGGDRDLRAAVFAYNHADWYVADVLRHARIVASLPAAAVDALAGLTEGMFPVDAPASTVQFEGEVDPSSVSRRRAARAETRPANDAGRSSAVIRTAPRARVVAVNDGVIEAVGDSPRLGRYVRLRDVYGNRFTYAQLGAVQEQVPVLRERRLPASGHDESTGRGAEGEATPSAQQPLPTSPLPTSPLPTSPLPTSPAAMQAPPEPAPTAPDGAVDLDEARRLAYEAVAGRPAAAPEARPVDPATVDEPKETPETFDLDDYFAIDYDLTPKDVTLKDLSAGRSVVAGTVLGWAAGPADTDTTGKPVTFEVRPAGADAPRIDPTPFLNGWRLADATDFFAASARTAVSTGEGSSSIGQILLMSKPELARRVLADRRISIYPCGRRDIRAGVIDRRILALLEVLAEKGVEPSVTSLNCGHGTMTASGNVSEHSTGDAVDIASVYGTVISPSTQGPGSVTDRAVREILTLQGTMRPHQIITLHAYAGFANTLALSDHDDHIHVGYRPDGVTTAASAATGAMTAEQWKELSAQLGTITSPVVKTSSAVDAESSTSDPAPSTTPGQKRSTAAAKLRAKLRAKTSR